MKGLLSAVVVATLLAGCATGRLGDDERLSLYRAHAGAPVKDFQYFGSLNGWTNLGDTALAVWTRPGTAYLLELAGPCNDLDFAPAISITNMMGRVSARFDDVIVLGGPRGIRIPCRIQAIRPLDVKALKTSEKELREAKVEERARPQDGDGR
ncbi:MAG: DUF6491 family protein [Gammaproteobacteria bacterium]|uniref:DUF6491 family protein n=1 Tax=Xanthomonas boreopolis TaxID=86183 RepID=UPI0032DC982F